MKTLKLDHALAEAVRAGSKRTTWRLFDDKNISLGDELELIDKVDPDNPSSWTSIKTAKVIKLVEKFLKDIEESDYDAHERFTSQNKMLSKYCSYYGKKVTLDTPVKVITFELNGDDSKFNPPLKAAKLYSDGGSRGNPGPSAGAFLICKMDDNVVEKSGFYIGITTNNQAEYRALLKGLHRSAELGIRRLNVFMDSELIAKQLNGQYKIKNEDLQPLYRQIKEIAAGFEKISFTHVPRAMNKEADGEVNRILDEKAGAL